MKGWNGVACALLRVGLELQAVGAKRHYTEGLSRYGLKYLLDVMRERLEAGRLMKKLSKGKGKRS